MKRTERILQDKKQNKISVKNGKPSSIDLKVNELTIRNTEEGLFFISNTMVLFIVEN